MASTDENSVRLRFITRGTPVSPCHFRFEMCVLTAVHVLILGPTASGVGLGFSTSDVWESRGVNESRSQGLLWLSERSYLQSSGYSSEEAFAVSNRVGGLLGPAVIAVALRDEDWDVILEIDGRGKCIMSAQPTRSPLRTYIYIYILQLLSLLASFRDRLGEKIGVVNKGEPVIQG